jgi:MFS family permease
MASPTIFAVIGDSLPRQKRAVGFTLQSILKRIPMAIAPVVGGVLIASRGVVSGVRLGLLITLALAALASLVVATIRLPLTTGQPTNVKKLWRSLHSALKRLLISDIIVRTGEGLVDVLVVLYVINLLNVSAAQYGALVALQMTTSMLVYLPAARFADRIGRKPFVVATFLCFALYPIAIVLSSGFGWLILAFVIGGLREIGEPSRKAMIVDFAEPHLRARTVGLYYLVRGLSITPAAVVGGVLWNVAPATPFFVAGIIGFIGVLVFALTVEEQFAS